MNQQADIFIETLQELLTETETKTSLLPNMGGGHKGSILRLLLPVSETGDHGLTDVALSDFTADQDLLHLHTTLIKEVGDGIDELRSAVSLWNESCPIGFFNVTENGSFVHRYTLPFPSDIGGKELAERTMALLRLMSGLLARYYPEAVKLSWPKD